MAKQFGTYTYDESFVVLTEHPEARTSKLRVGDRIGEHGGYTGGGLQSPGRLTMTGIVFTPSFGTPNIRELWRDFESAHRPGPPQQLRLDYFGEYFMYAEVESVTETQYSPPLIGARAFEVDFYLSDPYLYGNQQQGPQSLNIGSSTNIYNGGSRYASPTVDFVVTHAGTVSITSDAGQMQVFCNLMGTYSVNAYERYVTRNTADYFYRWDGMFPSFAPGDTTVAVNVTWGSVSQASATWYNRY